MYTGATDAINVVARSASGTVGNVYSVPVADPSSRATDAVNVVARSASGTVGNVYSVPVAGPSSRAPTLPGKRRSYENAVANC